MPENIDNSEVSPYAFFDDPLFLSTNDQPNLKPIDYKFNSSNFMNWKRDTYVSLISKNKEGFIDGSVKKPDSSDKKYHQWMRCDILVRHWMRNSMDDDIKENMSYANSSKELWDELIERYGDVNAIEIYQLRKDLNAISQGNTSLVEYYSNMKRTWENLDTLDPIPTCTCGALSSCTCQLLKRILDRDTHAKLIQFLMGLNSGYEGVKTNILSMEPLPPLNKALSLLQKIERQKQISDAVDVLGKANAYAAGVEVKQPDLKKAKKDNSVDDDAEIIVPKKCTHCNKKGHSIDECFQLKTCSFCGKKGHIQSICKWYKQSRSFRGRGRGGYGRGNSARGGYSGRNANNADVMQYEDYLQDDPLMDFSSSSQNNTSFNSDMVDGIVDSVVQRVMKSFGDRASNNSVSTANFAGPFK